MKHKTIYLSMVLCVALAVLVSSAQAQNKRVGTSAAPELLIPVGARDLAMGGSTIATSTGVEAIHWNPAGLGRLTHSAEGMFSSMSYIADISVSYGAVGAAFGDFGVVALSVKTLDFGDIPLTTEDDPENFSSRFFSPTFVTVGLSYARGLTDAVSFGGTVKIVSEQIDRVSAAGFALDMGVQYNRVAGISGLSLGVAVKNVGPQMKFDGPGMYRNAVSTDGRRPNQKFKSEAASFELPSVVEIGLAYSGVAAENVSYSLNGSFANNNLFYDEYNLGGEVGYSLESVKLFGRVGLGLVPQTQTEEADLLGSTFDGNLFGATFGVGVSYAAPGIDITVDFAQRQVDLFGANSVLSVKFGF